MWDIPYAIIGSNGRTLFRAHVAETILASVHVQSDQQAGHMNAYDPIKSSMNACRAGVVHTWRIDALGGAVTSSTPWSGHMTEKYPVRATSGCALGQN